MTTEEFDMFEVFKMLTPSGKIKAFSKMPEEMRKDIRKKVIENMRDQRRFLHGSCKTKMKVR